MTCIRTGANVYLAWDDSYAHCDLHLINDVYIARISEVTSHKPKTIHAVIDDYDMWTHDKPYGTLVSRQVSRFNYEGFAP